jgi:hypothetical protein
VSRSEWDSRKTALKKRLCLPPTLAALGTMVDGNIVMTINILPRSKIT